MKPDCDISKYVEHIQGIDDSELLDILGHISKNSVPDRYKAVVQECMRRGLIGKGAHSESIRKVSRTRNVKRTILIGIRLFLLLVLLSIVIFVSSQSGLDDGLMVGLAVFLAYGGIDILFLTIWLDD